MSKLLYTCFTKLIVDYFLSCKKNIPRRSDSKLHSKGDDSSLTKLSNTVKGTYKFRMKIPDTMINDAFKQSARYKYYKAKKAKSKKAKAFEEPEEQYVRFAVQFLLTPSNMCLLSEVEEEKDTSEESAKESNDADDSNMDITDDEPKGDDDTARYGVFMYNKSTKMPKSTYFSLTITSSSLDLIQDLLDETPVNELTDLMSNPIYTDAHTTSMVHNPKGNPEIKKLLPTNILTAVANYVRHRLNTFMLEVMKNNQISLFTKSSTSADDLSKMDLKIKPMNRIHLNKSNDTRSIHQQLYDTLYESISFDQEALNAQDEELSFHKRPSTAAIAKKLKALIQKDELTITYFEGAGLEKLKQQYTNDVELKYHVDQLKAAMLSEAKWCKETNCYHFEAHDGIHHWEDSRINFFKAEMSNRSEWKVYSDLRIKSVVQFVKEFNNALLLFISRVVIQNRVKDIQLGVESYQQTLILTKPMMFFEEIDQKLPITMSKTYKGVVYLNQHNIKSFMKFSEVKKLCDGTLMKIRDNLIDMVNTNKLVVARKGGQKGDHAILVAKKGDYGACKLLGDIRAFLVIADVPEIYMQEFWATATVHHHAIRFKMDNKKHIVNLESFRDMLHICPRVPGQSFAEPSFEEEILAFIRFLGHSAAIRTLTDVNINKLYQPWSSFAAINKCLTGKSSSYDSLRLSQAQILWGLYYKRNVDYAYLMWEDFVYQVEHKDHKKSNEMYYPRFTQPKASIRKTRSSSDTTITPPTTAAGPRLTTSVKGKQAAKASKAKSLSALSEDCCSNLTCMEDSQDNSG
nr:hypothetical protein [Tanacetum cinerariifolium]